MGFQSGKSTLLIFPLGARGDDWWWLTTGSQGRQEAVSSLSSRSHILVMHTGHWGDLPDNCARFTRGQGAMESGGRQHRAAPSTEWGTLYTHCLTSLVPTGKKLPSMQGQVACLEVHSSDTYLAQGVFKMLKATEL